MDKVVPFFDRPLEGGFMPDTKNRCVSLWPVISAAESRRAAYSGLRAYRVICAVAGGVITST